MASAVRQSRPPATSYVPVGGYVPNAAVAVKIAEAVLIPVYGDVKLSKLDARILFMIHYK
jgi:hypothetical protein